MPLRIGCLRWNLNPAKKGRIWPRVELCNYLGRLIMLALYIHYAFLTYMIMIAARLIASWFPTAQRSNWLYQLSRLTDPYLNLFRRMIPPIGGVLDLSPILAYLALQFLEYWILRLLNWY